MPRLNDRFAFVKALKSYLLLAAMLCGHVSLLGQADLSKQYTWAPIRVGAGGWAQGILIHPADSSVRYLRNDTGQAYRWDAARQEWMLLCVKNDDGSGMPGSPLSFHFDAFNPRSLALDPHHPNVVYLYATAGEKIYYGSLPMNVYKSVDGGRNFVATNFSQAAGYTVEAGDVDRINFRFAGERVIVDPNNSDVVYVGTGNKGMFRSTNGGIDWTALTGAGLPADSDYMNVLPYRKGGMTQIGGVTVSKTIFLVCAAGKVCRSDDGGVHWTQLDGGPTGHCGGLAILDQNGALYVPTHDTGDLWKYEGAGWTKLKTGGCTTVTVDPRNPLRIFVAQSAKDVSRSLDGGKTWTHLGFRWASTLGFAGRNHPTYRSISQVCLDQDGYVWCIGGNDGVWKWRSDDASDVAAWTPDCKGVENFCAMDIAIPKGGGGKAYLAVMDENCMVVDNFDDFSVTPVEPQPNLSVGSSLAVCPNDPNTFVLRSNDHSSHTGSWSGISTDGGKTYAVFKNLGPLPPALTDTYSSIAISRRGAWKAGEDHIVMLGDGKSLPYFSKDGGKTWAMSKTVVSDLAYTNTFVMSRHEIVADPFVPDLFYACYPRGGFWVSTDGGETWTPRTDPGVGCSEGQEPVRHDRKYDVWVSDGGCQVHVNHLVKNDIWVAGSSLVHSTDGGRTWEIVTNNGNSIYHCPVALGAGRGEPGDAPYTVYYLASGKSGIRDDVPNDYGVYRSTDAGVTWDRISYYPCGIVMFGTLPTPRINMAANWDVFGEVALALFGRGSGCGFVYGRNNRVAAKARPPADSR